MSNLQCFLSYIKPVVEGGHLLYYFTPYLVRMPQVKQGVEGGTVETEHNASAVHVLKRPAVLFT